MTKKGTSEMGEDGTGGSDWNLLLGVLALQMDLVSRDALIEAMNAWVLDKGTPLGRVLVGRGDLAEEDHALLDALVRRHHDRHRADPARGLGAVAVDAAVVSALRVVDDFHVQASLAQLGTARGPEGESTDEGPDRTETHVPPTGTGAGRFRVLRLHDRGGLGEVYLARDAELNREVALKRLKPEHADDPQRRMRFLVEAEITGGLEHPGIVPVYSLGADPSGRPFYAMRFIRGDNLKAAADRFHADESCRDDPSVRALERRRLLRRFLDVCNAVAYAHARGVLHRDLKPGNVMLGKYGETLVVDWGLAKSVHRLDLAATTDESALVPLSGSDVQPTEVGARLGTPAYMSPEQARGELDGLGPHSDVYSLGATLYYVLTGRAPFTDREFPELLRKVERGEFPAPRAVRPEIDPALDALCRKAMALAPAERYEDPRALAEDLERWLADEPTTAYREPARRRLGRWARRHRTSMAAAFVLLAVLAASSVPLTVLYRQKAGALASVESARNGEKAERARADSMLYLNSVALANRELNAGNFDRADELLEQCPQALRATEWFFLKRRCHPEELIFRGHDRPAGAVAISPDKQWVASGDEGGRVLLWDARTGKDVRELAGHNDRVMRLMFHPEGKWLASASLDGTVRLWDPTTGTPVRSWKDHTAGVADVAFHPDGRFLASAGWDGQVLVRRLEGGETVRELQAPHPVAVALAFDLKGDQLAVAGTRWDQGGIQVVAAGVRIWSTKSWETTVDFPIEAHAYLNSIVFRPTDGAMLLGSFGKVDVHDPTTGAKVGALQGPGGQHQAIDATGSVLATAWGFLVYPGGQVRSIFKADDLLTRDPTTGATLRVLEGQAEPTADLAISREGGRLVTAGVDGTVRLWDPARDPRSVVVRGEKVAWSQFSPNGGRLALSGKGRTIVYDSSTGGRLAEIAGEGPVTWLPDGKALIVQGSRYEADSGRPLVKLEGDVRPIVVAISHDGRRCAALEERRSPNHSDGPIVRIWDTADGRKKCQFTMPEKSGAFAMEFSPDGRFLATGDAAGSGLGDQAPGVPRLWDAESGSLVREFRGHTAAVYSLDFDPEGRLIASAGQDRTIRLWDVVTGEQRALLRGPTALIFRVQFSPDGRRLVSLSNDQTVRVWDVATGRAVFLAHGISRGYDSIDLRFLDNSTRLVLVIRRQSAPDEVPRDQTVGRLVLWHIESGQELARATTRIGQVDQVTLSENGRRAALIAEDGAVEIFDLSTPHSRPGK